MPATNAVIQGKRKVVAVIPARGGSKGIPGKNLADLGGKPLIAHSILAALNCSHIERVIVSTDSGEIARVARDWGAETPFLRPRELATDTASPGEVLIHALKTLEAEEGYTPEAAITLYPTHPFRSRALMDVLTAKLLEGYWNVCTVRPISAGDGSFFVPDGEQGLRPMTGQGDLSPRRFYRHYGLFVGQRRLPPCAREYYVHLLTTEAELVDIDDPGHLERANALVAGWNPEA